MKLAVFGIAIPLALCSAKAIPELSSVAHNAILDSRGDDPFSWDLQRRAQKKLSFSDVKKEMAKEFDVEAADGDLKLKWDPKSNCSKCKGNQVEDKDKKGKCKDCKKGTKPNSDHTKCVQENGCEEDEIKKAGSKECTKCPPNQEPDDKGTKCKDKKDKDDDRPDKEKGNCPEGQILDPAEGGQDSKTKNPKCISDDDKKCPKGQSAVSRLTTDKIDESSYEPRCKKDDNPDFKCKDKDTYDHREDVNDKIKHTCRSTRQAKEDKKEKYEKTAKDAKEKKKNSDSDKRDKKRRTRAGWCFAALSAIQAEAFTADDVKDMPEDEMDGMFSIWPDDKIPDPVEIPDYVVGITPFVVVGGEIETRGLGSLFGSIGRLFGKGGSKGGGGAGPSGLKTAIDDLKAGLKPASKKSVDKAQKSSRVQKMLKSTEYLDCLGTTPALISSKSKRDSHPQKNMEVKATQDDGSGWTLTVDWSLERDEKIKDMPKDTPDDKNIKVSIGKETDSTDRTYQTYHDEFVRSDRLYYKECTSINDYLDNETTDVETEGGCCTFYDSEKCEGTPLFSMYNREDGELKGDDNNAISSFWCTFDVGCDGAPGQE